MSYCRWSTDDWRCDLYCYERCDGGWMTHVAAMKRKDVPRIMADFMAQQEEWLKQYQEQMLFLKTAALFPIGLPYDGESFRDPTLQEFKARLLMLRGAGYSFPDYVLEQVDEEMSQGTSA